ncbi:phosphoprotein ECPP44-like [Rhododendron vialii]|uniref:phosphoprotein ECPP44-like n=1 Tax=Rhododendron vialii TaxID=182163 RepID=UPI00266014DE|nr:phosphoprotein ECPP44-like [Rhododendron vialii]
MAEPHQQGHGSNTTSKLPGETRDCGIFDCFGKKQHKLEEDSVMTDHAKEPKPNKMKEDKHTLNIELHRSRSNSSSSSYEEAEGGEKKRKKKQLKEKIKEKITSEKEEGVSEHEEVSIPFEKCDQLGNADPIEQEEKKGFLEKIKEKLSGQHKKAEEVSPAPPPDQRAADGNSPVGGEAKDKRGILDKIKEKLPGYNKNDRDQMKAKEN